MKDITEHVTKVVTDQLAKSCRSHGIDLGEAGYAIGGYGQFSAIPTGEQLGFSPAWNIVISLRSKLLGKPAIGVSRPVLGVLPSDDDFRSAVDRLVTEADTERGAEFSARPLPEL